jgi:hypothetical protein
MKNKAKAKDNGRKWMWWFLAVVILLQMYFVKELLAAFALFAMGFAAIGFVVASLYMLQMGSCGGTRGRQRAPAGHGSPAERLGRRRAGTPAVAPPRLRAGSVNPQQSLSFRQSTPGR